jgi:hypothetical protein
MWKIRATEGTGKAFTEIKNSFSFLDRELLEVSESA